MHYTERIVKVHGVFPSSYRVFRIFTKISISPSQYRRQSRNRYIIQAGRNLPAKEFRYLRTVRVTAAVYPGFRSGLSSIPLTLGHRADLRPHTLCYHTLRSPVFLVNSRFLRFRDTKRKNSEVSSRGSPSSEVTELFCRVPSILLSHSS